MATATLECKICFAEYDSGDHKPLCLNCGHTFCLYCILRLPANFHGRVCPNCRKRTSQPIDQMVVNYELIPSGSEPRQLCLHKQSETPCPHHQNAQDYFCVDCMELLCCTCTRETHVAHKIELLDDLLQEDEAGHPASVVDSWSRIRSTMQRNFQSVSSFVSLSDDIFGLAKEILSLKIDFEGWKAQKVSTEQDLEVWADETRVTDENKRQKLKGMLSQLKLKSEENRKIKKIKARLDAASMKWASLESQTCKLMPPDERWIVTSSDEGERALASLANNRKPSRLVVLSTHTRPIPGLGELLSRLAAHHTGDISLLPLDSFWRPAGQSGHGMGAIIEKFGRKLTTVYGTPIQVMAHRRAQYRTVCDYNVRFDCCADLIRARRLARRIENVCCVRSVPREIGKTLKARGCVVTRWHFPDLRDEDVNWMSSILAEYYDYYDPAFELVLPRDRLTDAGARQLFKNRTRLRKLYHEPNAAHLKSACNPYTKCIELTTTNILHWA
ncbi:uncharacterized protein LOC108679179 [Hyalella azteca]|uniref:Uncharacterized protein LOC108679179 n=1 Tax=Hyalella azteca TaxID=294128 RepID=A0A8B7PDC9_HYAAZ|nr:uncharacterized protein LOC108679179 [Hyalella azteca]